MTEQSILSVCAHRTELVHLVGERYQGEHFSKGVAFKSTVQRSDNHHLALPRPLCAVDQNVRDLVARVRELQRERERVWEEQTLTNWASSMERTSFESARWLISFRFLHSTAGQVVLRRLVHENYYRKSHSHLSCVTASASSVYRLSPLYLIITHFRPAMTWRRVLRINSVVLPENIGPRMSSNEPDCAVEVAMCAADSGECFTKNAARRRRATHARF